MTPEKIQNVFYTLEEIINDNWPENKGDAPYKFNEYGEEKSWYNAGDDYDEFYNSVRKITRNFLRDKED